MLLTFFFVEFSEQNHSKTIKMYAYLSISLEMHRCQRENYPHVLWHKKKKKETKKRKRKHQK